MNILFENPDKLNGQLTVTIEKEDYQEEVEKALKDYRKKANMPGFRPGQTPIGLIRRQFGAQVKLDIVQKLVNQKIDAYIKENKIQMLGHPMFDGEKSTKDVIKADAVTFVFDVAVAPEFKAELTADDTITYYNINVDDELVNRQVEMFQSRAGHYDKAEEYDAAQNDMLKGDLRELDADGNAKEDGIVVEGAVIMPEYIKVEEQKNLFNGAKPGTIITFNPRKAYPEGEAEIASLLKIDKEKAAEMTSDFTYQVLEISRFVKGEVNQQLFDMVYGEGNVKDEAEFRAKIAEGVKSQLTADTDYKFLLDVRQYVEDKVGELTFPDELLKRIMHENNPEKDDKFIEDNYEASIKVLKWNLIKEQLVRANGINVEDADLRSVATEAARVQFAQYGMNNVPEEYLKKYADDMLKDDKSLEQVVERAIDVKLIAALKGVVKLDEKSISLDDFNKMMQEK